MKVLVIKRKGLRNAELNSFLSMVATHTSKINCERVEDLKQCFINAQVAYSQSLIVERKSVAQITNTEKENLKLVMRALKSAINNNLLFSDNDKAVLYRLKSLVDNVDLRNGSTAQFSGMVQGLLQNISEFLCEDLINSGVKYYIDKLQEANEQYQQAVKTRSEYQATIEIGITNELRSKALKAYLHFINVISALSEMGLENFDEFIALLNSEIALHKQYCLSTTSINSSQPLDDDPLEDQDYLVA